MKFKLCIGMIRKYFSEKTKNAIEKIKDSTLDNYTRILLSKKEDKTTTHLIEKQEVIDNQTINNSFIINYSSYSLVNDDLSNISSSTLIDSKINLNAPDISEININNEKSLNSARAFFCLKYKLYDIPLTKEYLNYNHPPKYKINDIYYIYLYPNEINTFCLTASGFLFKNNMIIDSVDKKVEDSEFNFTYGIYFCNKIIEINVGDKIETKKCAPNNFICRICMKINKEKYKIKDNYLISINGRISKKNKGSYHCFGHFSCGNQIKDCITKYTCKACKLLNYYSKIYA